jgi:hypothetical protein
MASPVMPLAHSRSGRVRRCFPFRFKVYRGPADPERLAHHSEGDPVALNVTGALRKALSHPAREKAGIDRQIRAGQSALVALAGRKIPCPHSTAEPSHSAAPPNECGRPPEDRAADEGVLGEAEGGRPGGQHEGAAEGQVTESSPPGADGIRSAPCGRGPARRSADRGLPRIPPFFKGGPDRTHLAVDPLLLRDQVAEGLSQGGRYPRLILASSRGPLLQGELLTPRARLHPTRACHPKTSPKHSRSILAFSPDGCHAKCDGTARPGADREDLPTGRTIRLGLVYIICRGNAKSGGAAREPSGRVGWGTAERVI